MFVSTQHKSVIVPYRPDLAGMIPHAKSIEWQGKPHLVVPHAPDETRLLRNMGMDIPAPIMSQYDWRGMVPYVSQKETAALCTLNSRAFILNDMGTGKTRAACFAADYLMRQGVLKRALIVAPISTLTTVWVDELFRHFPGRSFAVLYGTKERRLERLAEDHAFYIINPDGIGVILEALKQRMGADDINCVVIDEVAVFRTPRTERWKAADAVVSKAKWVWAMTGRPTPNAPTDAWAQVKLVNPVNVPRHFGQFREQTMTQVSQFRWAPRPNANDTVFRAMQPAVRYKREEVVELPETQWIDRTVDLTPEQKHVFDELARNASTQVKEGTITALNEGVMMGKLLQVASGWVYTNNRGTVALPVDPRADALMEFIDSTDRKVIVFVPFIHTVQGLAGILRANGYRCETVYGDTAKAERDRIFMEFQHNALGPEVLIAHPQTMAHGLTLTSANIIVWWAPFQSLEIYEQANARITRAGQTAKTLIVHLLATKMEREIYSRLRKRQSLQGALLSMFEG